MKAWTLVFLFATAFAKHELFIGWKSYYVGPSTQEQVRSLGTVRDAYELDFLSHAIVGREGVVLVKPAYQDVFTAYLENEGIAYRVHSDNVKASLDKDDILIEARRNATKARNGRNMPYHDYPEWEAIEAYIDYIASRFPSIVTVVTAGNSFQGRPIRYLKISTTNFQDTSKPVIVIDGGIHAREWISPPSVTYMIRKLTEDLTEPDLLTNYDWILLPVVNPDGYIFTFTTNRFWRKTRSTDTNVLSFLCPGVDGNRNYDFFFNTVGVTSNPCGDTYPGDRAFSEVETRVVRDIVLEHLSRIALYITVHSYGSMVLYPWGHDGSLSHNGLALHVVGVAMASAIDAHSIPGLPNYIVGNAVLVLDYAASGASEDWAHLVGVPLSYTFELPGLGGGYDGFHLNPIYIEQVVRETWEGIAVGARRAGDLFVARK